MFKIASLFCSFFAVALICIGLSACKDDEPYVKPSLSISTEDLTVSEDAGIIEIELVLDNPAPADIVIQYTLAGTATVPDDYGIMGKDGEFTIHKGDETAAIGIEIANDAVFEDMETVEILLQNTADIIYTGNVDVLINIMDDDLRVTASFETPTMTVSESDSFVEIAVLLSHPASENVFLKYSLGGTATDSIKAKNSDPVLPIDYAVRGGSPGQLNISKGEKKGIIRLKMSSDFIVEDEDLTTESLEPETIIVTLTEASSTVQISPSNNGVVVNVNQEDGRIIGLYWDENVGVDMDLVLWTGSPNDGISDLKATLGSYKTATDGLERIIIPSRVTDGFFGLSYVYYSGNKTPLDFEVHFIDFANGDFESRNVYEATYTLANQFTWQTISDLNHIEQTFRIAQGQLTDISAVFVPTTGSRLAPTRQKSKKPVDIDLARKN